MENGKSYYWMFQLIGWSVYGLLYVLFSLTQANTSIWDYLSLLFYLITGIILTHGLRWIIKRNSWLQYSFVKLGISVIVASVIVGVIYGIFYFINLKIFVPDKLDTIFNPAFIVVGLINISIIVFIWQILYFGSHYVLNLKSVEAEKWRFQAEAKEAQLNSLKSQLNPHFIFNSLNSVRALILIDPYLAQEMITKLSNMMRYSLQSNNKELVTFEEEMLIVDDYLNLEKIRFEERLIIEKQIEENISSCLVPPMIIQTLVENAIKHGISNEIQGGKLEIAAKIVNDDLIVSITNPGTLTKKHSNIESTKTGIRNSSDRLKLLFGGKGNLSLENLPNHQVKAIITIPQEKLHESHHN